MRKTLAIAFAALALTTTPAAAEPVAFELRITHGDLDLASDSDVQTMRERIRSEVRKACAIPARKTENPVLDRACIYETTRVAFEKLEEKRARETEIASL